MHYNGNGGERILYMRRGIRQFLRGLGLTLLLASCAAAEEPAEQGQWKKLRLLFVGDIMAHKEQLEGARRAGGEWDFTPQFRRLKPRFEKS